MKGYPSLLRGQRPGIKRDVSSGGIRGGGVHLCSVYTYVPSFGP